MLRIHELSPLTIGTDIMEEKAALQEDYRALFSYIVESKKTFRFSREFMQRFLSMITSDILDANKNQKTAFFGCVDTEDILWYYTLNPIDEYKIRLLDEYTKYVRENLEKACK